MSIGSGQGDRSRKGDTRRFMVLRLQATHATVEMNLIAIRLPS